MTDEDCSGPVITLSSTGCKYNTIQCNELMFWLMFQTHAVSDIYPSHTDILPTVTNLQDERTNQSRAIVST